MAFRILTESHINKQMTISYTNKNIEFAQPFQLKKKQSWQQKKTLRIFLHIPKCAGTSLEFIQHACCSLSRMQYTRFPVSGFTPPVHLIDGWTGAWDTVRTNNNLVNQFPAVISGHFPYGVHQFYDNPCRYITILRNPVDREISSFNFHHQIGFYKAENLSNMIETHSILDNPQVRMLAGVKYMSGECNKETYNMARKNLASHFDLVGVTEQSNEFINAVLATSGWPPVAYHRHRVTGDKVIVETDSTLNKALNEYHKFDMLLYKSYSKKWIDWIKKNKSQNQNVIMPDDKLLYIPNNYEQTHTATIVSASNLSSS